MPPSRSASRGSKPGKGKPKAAAKPAVSTADAALTDWGSIMGKASRGGDGAGKGGNFVSLLDANALRGVKGKGKGKGNKGLLSGAGDGEEASATQCSVCLVADGSVYPPYPRCEISIAALAAIARYHLTKPKKKPGAAGGGRRGASSPTKSSSSPKAPSSPTKSRAGGETAERGKSPPNKSGSGSAAAAAAAATSTSTGATLDDGTNNNIDLAGAALVDETVIVADVGGDVAPLSTSDGAAPVPTPRKGDDPEAAGAAGAHQPRTNSAPAIRPPRTGSSGTRTGGKGKDGKAGSSNNNDAGGDDNDAAAADAKDPSSSMAHLFYCLTCRCLYDQETNNWMPHRVCERCLYCTHGYCDVRTLDLSPNAPTVCKDGLPVPQSYGEVRAQADKRIHWILPLSESDVLQGRPNLLPPEQRDFKSAMRRAGDNKDKQQQQEGVADSGDGGDGSGVKPFDYDQALVEAVCSVIVAGEEHKRKSLEAYCSRHHMIDGIEMFSDFACNLLQSAAKHYSSQVFLIQEKCRQETKKLRTAWLERVKAEQQLVLSGVEEFAETIERERNASFEDIWMQVQVSRGEMVRLFPSKDLFDMAHSEALARTTILHDEHNLRYIRWRVASNIPDFVVSSAEFRRTAFEQHKELQREVWKEMNTTRLTVGAERLFDQYGFRQIVTCSTISRLWVQLQAEGEKMMIRDGLEKQARWDLRYATLRSKLQAIESEKRRGFAGQRLHFITTLMTVKEGEERTDLTQLLTRELSSTLSRLRKQAKAEGLFPDPKKLEAEASALQAQLSSVASFRAGKGMKLVIPNIPYKKPAAPVPAAAGFIADVQASLTRAFSGVDDVIFLDDGRIALVAAKEDPDGAALAKDRVQASFQPAAGSSKGVSMVRSSGRAPLFGVQYVDPEDIPECEELKPEVIIANAAMAVRKMKGRRRGATGGKKDDYNVEAIRTSPPANISALEFMGEVALSLKNPQEQQLAWTIHLQPSKKRKRLQAAATAAMATAAMMSSSHRSNSPAAAGTPDQQQQQQRNSPSNQNNDDDDDDQPQQQQNNNNNNNGNGSNVVRQQPSSSPISATQSGIAVVESFDFLAPVSPVASQHLRQQQQQQSQQLQQQGRQSPLQPNEAVAAAAAATAATKQQSPLHSPAASALSPGSSPRHAPPISLATPGNAASSTSGGAAAAAATNGAGDTIAPGKMTAAQAQQFLNSMIDRSILSSNLQGRPATSLIDDDIYNLFFCNSIRREELALQKAVRDTDELIRLAMERLCVPPAPRHKRERKPAWVESRAAEVFKNAEIPPLPPPPPPPPKPKPKPKGAHDPRAGKMERSNRPGSADDEGGDGKKKRVKFTEDGQELEFPEDGPGGPGGKPRPKAKRSAPKADPALLAAMSASQSQREMMRQMSLQAAGEDGADMESAAFGMGYHDGDGGDGEAGSAFSLLLSNALTGPKKKGGKRGSSGSGRKKPGRHYEFM